MHEEPRKGVWLVASEVTATLSTFNESRGPLHSATQSSSSLYKRLCDQLGGRKASIRWGRRKMTGGSAIDASLRRVETDQGLTSRSPAVATARTHFRSMSVTKSVLAIFRALRAFNCAATYRGQNRYRTL